MLYGHHEATPVTPNRTGLVALNLSGIYSEKIGETGMLCISYIYSEKSAKFGLCFPSQFVFQAIQYI